MGQKKGTWLCTSGHVRTTRDKGKDGTQVANGKDKEGGLSADRGPLIGNLWAEGISDPIKIQVVGT